MIKPREYIGKFEKKLIGSIESGTSKSKYFTDDFLKRNNAKYAGRFGISIGS